VGEWFNPSVLKTEESKGSVSSNLTLSAKHMKKFWIIWKYTIGSFSDEKTAEYDDQVAILRSIIVLINSITCFAIVANIIHNW
jgi:hypothetical protein